MIFVIVKIDGFFEHAFLIGKTCSIADLKDKYEIVKTQCTNTKQLIEVFCELFQFERMSLLDEDDVRSDFVIDTDTDRIYVPRY